MTLTPEQQRLLAQQGIRELRQRKPMLDDDSIDVILSGARSHYAWTDKPVPRSLLKRLYEITASGATSMNCCPARFVFVTSAEGKERLAKSLKEKNIEKMQLCAGHSHHRPRPGILAGITLLVPA